MGLDMWATISKSTDNEEREPLADWRKHNRLHGYMEELWNDKGKPNSNDDIPEVFNCVPLELTKEDIKDLKATILTWALPKTQGFFFGRDSYDWSKDELDEADEYDLNFCEKALIAINKGYKVHYNSWW